MAFDMLVLYLYLLFQNLCEGACGLCTMLVVVCVEAVGGCGGAVAVFGVSMYCCVCDVVLTDVAYQPE